MPFDNSLTLLAAFDGGLRQKTFRLRAIESRMDAGDVVEHLRNPDPARQHGDIGDEGDIAHETDRARSRDRVRAPSVLPDMR